MKQGYKICPYCGEEIKEIAKKCRFCGTRLDTKLFDECNNRGLSKGNSINKQEKNLSTGEIALIVIGVIFGIFMIFGIIGEIIGGTSQPNCETLYNNFKSNNTNLGFVDNSLKYSRDNNCIAYIEVTGTSKNGNVIDLNVTNQVSITTYGNEKRKGFYGYFIVNLNSNSLLTGSIIRLPDDKDINGNNSISTFNSMDLAKSNAINYYNNI